MADQKKMGFWGHLKDESKRFNNSLAEANAGMKHDMAKAGYTDNNTDVVKTTTKDSATASTNTEKNAETSEDIQSVNADTTATEGKDGANESNKSSKNVDEQKSATFDPWVNQLLDYEPYNYIISLSCVSPAQFNFGSQFHGGELILKSGGKGAPGSGPLKNDFYIDNLVIRNTVSPTSQSGLASVYQVLFDIIEPYGVDFIAALGQAASKMGYANHLKAVYRLDIQFKGYNSDNKPSAGDIPMTARSIFIHLYQVDFNIEAGVTTYQVQAVPASMLATTEVHGVLQESLTCVGNTVQEVVESFFTEYNLLLKQQQADGKAGTPDEYRLVVSSSMPTIMDAKIDYDESASSNKNVLNFDHIESETVGKTRQITVPKGTSIQKFIEDVIRASTFYSEQFDKTTGNPKDPGGFMTIGRIYFKLRILSGDNGNNRPPYQFGYILREQKVSASYFDKNATSATQRPTRTYNYIHTGQNSDILDFDLTYKFAYYQAIPYFKDAQSNSDNTDDPAGNHPDYTPYEHGGQGTTDISNVEKVPQDTDITNLVKGHKQENSEFSNIFEQVIMNPSADLIIVSMEILGDPCWIQHKGADNRGFANTFVKETPNLDKHGSVQPDEVEQYVEVKYNPPVDINDDTGLFKLKGINGTWFSGRYKVYMAENRFQGGVYTTTLEMVRARYQPTDDFSGTNGKTSGQDGEKQNGDIPLPLISIEFTGNNSRLSANVENEVVEDVIANAESINNTDNVEVGNATSIFNSKVIDYDSMEVLRAYNKAHGYPVNRSIRPQDYKKYKDWVTEQYEKSRLQSEPAE